MRTCRPTAFSSTLRTRIGANPLSREVIVYCCSKNTIIFCSFFFGTGYVKLYVLQLYDVPGTLICLMHSMLQDKTLHCILIIISDMRNAPRRTYCFSPVMLYIHLIFFFLLLMLSLITILFLYIFF